ncbi:MAG TPA: phosphate ABC transporter ATP-binding protein PstB [Candidatus Bathyarchaeia archaeon]|nr:phosphate ABC transporter ATP-binding protein PstB [Candidatus Bathyarchaeia archaeon]
MKDKMKVEDLDAGFGKKTVLEKISVGFKENSVTALIGPSGCGKSTFIRCLNRMHEVTPGAWISGKIILDEDQILEGDPVQIRRRIGMVFQRPNPFPTMSVFENVAAGLKLNGVRDKKLIASRVEESLRGAALLEEVGDRLHHESGASLSGGQQQRLCIARTLAVAPEVVLMDEPCSALDPMATAKIEELITQLKAKYTVIVVTHNMQQAARISDMTGFLYLGKLVEYGPTEQIFSNPHNELTERYISGKFG